MRKDQSDSVTIMERKMDTIWCVTITLLAAVSVFWAVTMIAGIELPDAVTRTIGIVALINIPIIVYTTVKKIQNKK